MAEKDNIPKASKFRYVTLLAVTALSYDPGLPIGNSHVKKNPTMLTNGIYSFFVYMA